jgi:hypothetical protein
VIGSGEAAQTVAVQRPGPLRCHHFTTLPWDEELWQSLRDLLIDQAIVFGGGLPATSAQLLDQFLPDLNTEFARALRDPLPSAQKKADTKCQDSEQLPDGVHLDKLWYHGRSVRGEPAPLKLLKLMLEKPARGRGHREEGILNDLYDKEPEDLKPHCAKANKLLQAVDHPERLSRINVAGEGYFVHWIPKEAATSPRGGRKPAGKRKPRINPAETG